MTHKLKLLHTWTLSGMEKSFYEWLIDQSEINHTKSVQMAGDLGEAYRKIGDLERVIDQLKGMESKL